MRLSRLFKEVAGVVISCCFLAGIVASYPFNSVTDGPNAEQEAAVLKADVAAMRKNREKWDEALAAWQKSSSEDRAADEKIDQVKEDRKSLVEQFEFDVYESRNLSERRIAAIVKEASAIKPFVMNYAVERLTDEIDIPGPIGDLHECQKGARNPTDVAHCLFSSKTQADHNKPYIYIFLTWAMFMGMILANGRESDRERKALEERIAKSCKPS